MKRVLFVIRELAGGGAERALSNIMMHFPPDWEIDLLMNNEDYVEFPYRGNILTLDIPEPKNRDSIIYQAWVIVKRIWYLRKIKKTNNYAACISFLDSSNIANVLSGNKYCKTIVSVRVKISQDKSFLYQHVVKPLASALYNKADYVVAVAEGVKKDLVEVLNIQEERVKTITNGFDVQEIEQQARQEIDAEAILSKLDGKFVFVSTGRYSYQKAQWHLIRAFSKVAKECEDVHLVLLGKGPDEEYLRNVIHENDLNDKVTLLPYQKNPFAWLNRCHVFVMPSMFEGYCNALCEALICGLPCVATDFQSSAREILAPETDYAYQMTNGIEYASYGVLTPVCSGVRYAGSEPLELAEESLADAMIVMYRDKSIYEKYKLAAKERGIQLDINMKVQEWLALL